MYLNTNEIFTYYLISGPLSLNTALGLWLHLSYPQDIVEY